MPLPPMKYNYIDVSKGFCSSNAMSIRCICWRELNILILIFILWCSHFFLANYLYNSQHLVGAVLLQFGCQNLLWQGILYPFCKTTQSLIMALISLKGFLLSKIGVHSLFENVFTYFFNLGDLNNNDMAIICQ